MFYRFRGSQVVEGDISLTKLGLSPEAAAFVESETNIILHCAATVNFDETLKLAVQLNTLGARRVLDMARNCKNLLAHVHVSTAYVNCIHNSGNIEIREKIYPLQYVSVGGARGDPFCSSSIFELPRHFFETDLLLTYPLLLNVQSFLPTSIYPKLFIVWPENLFFHFKTF